MNEGCDRAEDLLFLEAADFEQLYRWMGVRHEGWLTEMVELRLLWLPFAAPPLSAPEEDLLFRF